MILSQDTKKQVIQHFNGLIAAFKKYFLKCGKEDYCKFYTIKCFFYIKKIDRVLLLES